MMTTMMMVVEVVNKGDYRTEISLTLTFVLLIPKCCCGERTKGDDKTKHDLCLINLKVFKISTSRILHQIN